MRAQVRTPNLRKACLKILKKTLLAIVVLLLAAAALLCWLPARWAMPLLQPSLHGLRLQQVGGTLWDGRADRVLSPDGRVLGRAQWQLSRRALFGQIDLRLDLTGPQGSLSGYLRRLPAGQVDVSDLHASMDLAALADPHLRWPWGQPSGELLLDAPHALLQGGWPLELQADWQWRQAVLHGKNGDVALGDLHGTLAAQGGVIHAQWQDDGHGPLRTAGTLDFSLLGWRFDAVLQPRQDDPTLRRWLATLGRPAADGSIHIARSGGMAAALTEKTAP